MQNTLEKIAALTSADYIAALEQVNLTKTRLEMLRFHYAAPSHMITANQLAHHFGWKNHNAANIHYGSFAGRIAQVIGVTISKSRDNLDLFVTAYKPPHSNWELTLRPAVVSALEKLSIVESDRISIPEEISTDLPLTEGTTSVIRVNAYERNPAARRKCITHYTPQCYICGFSFGEVYGDAASNYIHVHHLKPLASIGKKYVINPVKDLRPVCANCHAVIHLRTPPYSLEEVAAMMKKKN